jgi:regulation of enolase protein 1 (concanavalin A-like superfamily)
MKLTAFFCLIAAIATAAEEPSQAAGGGARELTGWGTVRDPLEMGKFQMKGRALTVDVAGGGTDYSQAERTAPSAVQEIEGDFIAMVTVQPGMTPDGIATTANKVIWNSAGLLVEVDKANFIRFELSVRKQRPDLFDNRLWAHRVNKNQSKWDQPILKEWDPKTPIHLRIQRTGAQFKWAYSLDKETWKELAPFETTNWPAKLNVGVVFVNLTSKASKATVSDLVIEKPE